MTELDYWRAEHDTSSSYEEIPYETMMSYEEYLQKTKQKDSRQAWKYWKMEVCGMSEKEAIKAAYSCYEPLKGR